MRWKKLVVVVVSVVLLVGAFVAVANTEHETALDETLLDDDIVVEDIAVNGEEDKLVIHENESVTVTATVTNEGDEPVDVPLVIGWDDEEDEGHKGTALEDLQPGETEDVEWEREEHGTWWPDNYIVRIGDETVNLIVVEDLNIDVEDLEVNGESDHLEISEDDPVTVTATVTNEGDETVDVPLIVAWDYELDEGHKGTLLEDLEPGETEDIEWEREEHGTWWPDEYTIIVGTESVDVSVEGEPEITVEDFTVNGLSDEIVVAEDDPVEITASVTNEGDDPVDVPLVVEWDDEVDEGHKGYVVEELEPGVTEDVEWEREEHATWSPNVYTVSLGEESITVTVVEELDITVEDLEVNGEAEDVVVGLNESVTVTATVTNNEDGPVNVPLVIEWDDEIDVGHKGYVLEGLGAGETDDVEWEREEHATWEEGEYTVSVGDETIQVTVEEEEDTYLPDIVIEDFTVNGESDEVQIGIDEEVRITATVRNEGDAAETVDLIVEGADDEEGHFGHTLELDPGDSEDIEWIMEQHDTWGEGDYTIRLGDESVEVTVGEPTDDPDEPVDDEVDWNEIRIVVGLIIAAFVIGIGVGVLWMKKR